MANEDSLILKEVDQALEEDKTWDFFRKNGAAVVGGAVLIVAGVAGWQFWGHMRTQTAERQALEFRNAVELLEENREAGRTALDAVAAEKGGYGALAKLRRAASYAAGGERLKALEIYRAVASGDAPRRIQEMARLRAGYLALADGRDAVMAELGGLADDDAPLSYYAKEILGIASFNAKDYESASATFAALSADMNAPEGIRNRAEEFAAIAAAGKDGVNLTGETQLEDLLKAVGGTAPGGAGQEAGATETTETSGEADETVGDDIAEDDHDDHNHEE